MGSTTFSEYVEGTNARMAFDEGVLRAATEHGHGGYTGSMAEKGSDGFNVLHAVPVSLAAARAMADDFLEKEDERVNSKWGPAGAIAVGPSESRSTDLVIQAPFLIDYSTVERWRPLVDAKAKLKAGEEITGCRVAEIDLDGVKFKISHRATEGKAVTRYIFGGQRWEHGLPSQAAARAAAAEALANLQRGFFGGGITNATLEVTAVTRREDGSALVVAERVITQTKARITVEISTVPKSTDKVTGWLFFGWASC